MIELLKDPLATGLLTLISAAAATLAAYFSWRQLFSQTRRWNAEDARKSPNVFIGLSGEYSNDGWCHGVWQVTNRADYQSNKGVKCAYNFDVLRNPNFDVFL